MKTQSFVVCFAGDGTGLFDGDHLSGDEFDTEQKSQNSDPNRTFADGKFLWCGRR